MSELARFWPTESRSPHIRNGVRSGWHTASRRSSLRAGAGACSLPAAQRGGGFTGHTIFWNAVARGRHTPANMTADAAAIQRRCWRKAVVVGDFGWPKPDHWHTSSRLPGSTATARGSSARQSGPAPQPDGVIALTARCRLVHRNQRLATCAGLSRADVLRDSAWLPAGLPPLDQSRSSARRRSWPGAAARAPHTGAGWERCGIATLDDDRRLAITLNVPPVANGTCTNDR